MQGRLPRPLRSLLDRAGRAYVPGASIDDALRVADRHLALGRACTLGCFSAVQDDPHTVAGHTAAIADALAARSPRGYVSIKAPSLRYELDALDLVLDRCLRHGLRAHFDSHDIGHAELTLACVEHAVERGVHTGLTLPGRWARSLDDAAHLAALGVRVRVVKGEWADPSAPGADPGAGVLALIDALVAARAPAVSVASHDVPLAREALARLQRAGVACSLELLHGLPVGGLPQLADRMGVPVTVYVPFGQAWRPYAMRQVLKRPRIAWWLLRDLLRGRG